MNFLGGPVGSKLIFYPLFIGLVLSLWRQYTHHDMFVEWSKFKMFILVYAGIIFVSLLHGLYIYPYYDLVLNGPVSQIEKLPRVIELLRGLGIYVDSKVLVSFWMIARVLKNFVFEIIYTFGGSYMIFCWYSKDWERGFRILLKAVCISLIVVLAYGCIDAGYLAGNDNCKAILILLNPFIHPIQDNGAWWPPLLWKGQLRTIFPEPSHFGMYAAFAMPFLWLYLQKNTKNYLTWLGMFLLMFFVVLTKARTAMLLMLGEIASLFGFVLWERKRKLTKHFVKIVIIGLVAFVCGIYFPMQKIERNDELGLSGMAGEYLKKNVTSIGDTQQRSNRSRYAIIAANISIGKEHSILGVGSSLRNAYITNNLPSWGYNKEVKMWINNQKEKGILRSGYPNLCEFAVRFSETGILGLLAFFLPIFNLFRLLFLCYRKTEQYKNEIMFFAISLLGSFVVGFGDGFNVLYAYWILLGIGYTMCYGIYKSKG
jgi:hypothetical protein